MGYRFRKSIKLGKYFRINLSKSGIGYSIGTKGYRVTKMANGRTRTTVSIPGTGISHVSETSGVAKVPARAPEQPAPPAAQKAPPFFIRALVALLIISALFVFAAFISGSFSSSEPTSTNASASPLFSLVPLDPVFISSGDYALITLSHGFTVDDLSSLTLTADTPGVVRFEQLSGGKFHMDFRIHGISPGACTIQAVYGDLQSNLISVTVSEANPDYHSTDTSPETYPASPVFYFTLNPSTNVIHRSSCSRAPKTSGKTTTDYYGAVRDGYKPCSYCFD